jgi:hypothetical protein
MPFSVSRFYPVFYFAVYVIGIMKWNDMLNISVIEMRRPAGFQLGDSASCPAGPVFAGNARNRQAHLAAFVQAARQRRVFGLTMAAEVSVDFPARPFGPCGSSRAGGKAVR